VSLESKTLRENSMFKNLDPTALGVSGHQSEIIELALTYGFRGIDVAIAEFATRVKLRGMPYARRLFDSAKIRVGRFPLPLDWEAEEEVFKKELEKLEQYAQVAAEVGCIRCVATIAPAGDSRPYHENFEFHRRRFAEICKALEPAGVWLGIGFRGAEDLRKGKAFQFVHDFDALSLLVNMVGAPNIGILLDVWNLYVSGGALENIRKLSGRQIVAVQLADAPLEEPITKLTEDGRLLPGSNGQIDLAAVLTVLGGIGYDGPVTPKPSRKALSGTRRDAAVKLAGEGLSRLWKAAGLAPEGRMLASAAR